MNWSDERYVRVYVRDTPDLLRLGWEGRAVWWELLRKVDRGGVIDGSIDVMPELLRIPPDVFSVGWARIVDVGLVEVGPRCVVVPNFIEAQETPQSDRQRQRERRARRRDTIRAEIAPDQKGGGHAASRGVMGSHAVSRAVTSGHSVPYRAVPCRTEKEVPTAASPVVPDLSSEKPDDPRVQTSMVDVHSLGAQGHRDVTAGFDAMFLEFMGAKPGWGAKQGRQVNDLLRRAGSTGPPEILRRARVMFGMRGRFPAEHPDLATLLAHWDKFVGAPADVRVGNTRAEDYRGQYGPPGKQEDV